MYPQYDVRKIVETLKHPKPDLINIFAHRGLRLLKGTTENSLSAVDFAAKEGYEGIEIDIRLTKDGEVVVLHDSGLGRVTNIQPPVGEEHYNPFMGKGYNPLVCETAWHGVMEHFKLRDHNGDVTEEHPILLSTLLSFIRQQGINMVIQLDIKSEAAMAPAYDIIANEVNASGVPALEWCIWKPKAEIFPTPRHWEQQNWVQHASSEGHKLLFVPLFERETDLTMSSLQAWEERDYLLTFELHVPRVGGVLQKALDFVLETGKGVGSWYIGGDVAREYYSDSKRMRWDDSLVRGAILASGETAAFQFREGEEPRTVGAILGHPPSPADQDGRVDLFHLINQGFTYIVADPFDDLHNRLDAIGKRNTTWMLSTTDVSVPSP